MANLIYGVTDDDLKQCVNRKCRRHRIPVYNQGKRCLECNGKLRHVPASDFESGTLIDTPLAKDEITMKQALDDAVKSAGSQSQSRTDSKPEHKGQPLLPRAYTTGYTPAKNDTFTCDPDVDGKCPLFTKDNTPTALVTNEMFEQWIWLAKKFSNEWIAYLRGHFDAPENQWVITSMYFPKQVVSGAHCEAEDGEIIPPTDGQDDTIGAVHSHVSMGVFWSSEDKKHANHTVEFVVNRKSDVLCSIRTQLECHRYVRLDDCRVFLGGSDASAALARELEAKVTVKTYSYQGGNGNYNHSTTYPSSNSSSSPNSGYRGGTASYSPSSTPGSRSDNGGTGANAPSTSTSPDGATTTSTPGVGGDPDIMGASSYGYGMDWMA